FAGAQFAELIIQISLGIVIRSGTIESIKDKRIGIIAVQDCNQIVTYGTARYIDTIIIREFYIKHWVWAHDISISKLIIVDVGLYNRGIIVRAGKGTITAYYKIGIYAHSLPAIIMGVQHHLTAAKVKIDVFGQNDTYLKLAISGSGTTSKQHAVLHLKVFLLMCRGIQQKLVSSHLNFNFIIHTKVHQAIKISHGDAVGLSNPTFNNISSQSF